MSASRPLGVLALLALGCVPPEDPTSGRQLYVLPAADGEWDDPDRMLISVSAFTTVQAAIDAASSGDTVNVPSGTYTENFDMKEGVNVVGAGQAETRLVGNATFTGLTSATLSDMSFYDGVYTREGRKYSGVGVYVDGGNAVIEDVSAHYYNHGIYIAYGADVVVNRVYLHDNWVGLFAQGTSNFELSNSLLQANPTAGFAAELGTGGRVVHNTFVGNGFGTTTHYLVGAVAMGRIDDPVIANNIIVSNDDGLNCWGCDGTWSNNLIWGNVTDYINDASRSATDLSADPGFADHAEGDYGLSSASVCIDAAAASYGASTDADGESRPQGAGYDIGMDEYAVSSFSLLVTEVMANAATESTGEFVEIYNAGASPVDLDGFVLTDGDSTDTLRAFGSGSTSLAAGAYAVVLDSDYSSGYTLDASVVLLTTGDTTLGNGLTTADQVTLFESDGSTVVATYGYASDPGDGTSMEMVDLGTGDASGNWRASGCSRGSSPGGAHCFPESGDTNDLVITEVMSNPLSESTGEYIEVYNPSSSEIDLAGLVISDGHSTDKLVSFGGGSTLLGPGAHALVLDSGYAYDYVLPTTVLLLSGGAQLGNGLATADSIYLYDTDGSTLIDSYTSPTNPGDGRSIEKIAYAGGDTSANWASAGRACTEGRSPGRLNGAAGGICGPIVITEVIANADDEDAEEFVELYNAGSDTIDLAGLVLSDGDASDTLQSFDGGSTSLAPGGWALIVDAEYADTFVLDAAVVLVTTGDTTLGNGLAVTDPVTLYEADGSTTIDAFLYPQNPGNAISVERLAWSGGFDGSTNWAASTCPLGASPGGENCIGASAGAADTSSYDIVITEVMANADSESTGEFVELYNAGASEIDVRGWVLYDGDATDTVQGFADPTDTLLAPGAYAVVLDADYDVDYATIPSGTLLLTTDDATLCSGLATDDPIYLYESNATSLVDSFTFPRNPGNAISAERVDVTLGDVESNWQSSTCSGGSSPGQGACP
ncbi:MAG: lamin tail domain-containing protein [Pseudomonadota bacterium]|nr:lamin tail domain-containing protein [Pseudomonadota bacterium]